MLYVLVGALVALVVLFFVYRKVSKNAAAFDAKQVAETVKTEVKEQLDTNSDGKVDMVDVKEFLDVNNDGRVNLEDAKEAGKKVKAKVKKVATKAKATVKKAKLTVVK